MTASYQAVKGLLSKGISRPTLYEVKVPNISASAQRQLSLLCSAAAVPEISTQNVLALGHDKQGVIRDTPAYVVFGKPFTITVISDRDYTVYKGVREWFETISTGANGGSQKMAYYNDFASADITLTKLELDGSGAGLYMSPFEVVFNNAFPTSIGELSLSSDAYDSRMEFTVSFAYETYTFAEGGAGSVTDSVLAVFNTLGL